MRQAGGDRASTPPDYGPVYRPDIDGLRALAVFAVVGYHAAPHHVRGGFVGVDIFFVISGFLITGIIWNSLASGSFTFLDFYQRRARRILPALIVVLIATWLLGFLLLWPRQFADLGEHVLAAAVFGSNFLLAAQSGYFGPAAETKQLLHLWSLAIEEQFYLVWPLLMFAAWKARINITALLLGVLVISFALCLVATHEHSVMAFYGPQNRAWELALGGMVALRPAAIPPALRPVSAITGLLLIVAAIALLNASMPYPGWRALLPTAGAALLILSGPRTIVARALSTRAVVNIGLISYPLYLWHWPLLSFAHVTGNWTLSVIAAAVLAAAALAFLTYRIVELPFRHGRISPTVTYGTIAASLLVTAVAATATWTMDGFTSRLDGMTKKLSTLTFDEAKYRGGTCLLSVTMADGAFAPECFSSGKGPLVVLWGDSHAAHLYPGIQLLQHQQGFSLAQFTRSACAPLVDLESNVSPHCRGMNDFVLGELPKLHPQTVVLAASWWAYDLNRETLKRTIDRIKAAGTSRIVLVGPVPVWTPTLPLVMLKFYADHGVFPDKMTAGLTRMNAIESELKRYAAEWGLIYVSAIDALCDTKGCKTRISEDPTSVVQYDASHLTVEGSAIVAGAIPFVDSTQH